MYNHAVPIECIKSHSVACTQFRSFLSTSRYCHDWNLHFSGHRQSAPSPSTDKIFYVFTLSTMFLSFEFFLNRPILFILLFSSILFTPSRFLLFWLQKFSSRYFSQSWKCKVLRMRTSVIFEDIEDSEPSTVDSARVSGTEFSNLDEYQRCYICMSLNAELDEVLFFVLEYLD